MGPENKQISSPFVGREGRVYIVAEIGLNHNGSFELAQKMIEGAARTGVDAVKFQNWRAEDFISDRTLQFTYKSRGREITEPFFDLCKRNELDPAWIPELTKICESNKVDFLSTPTSKEGVDDLVRAGIRVIKNGSDYLGHTPLISYMAENSDVVVISTGMANRVDIDEAVAAASGKRAKIVLLHCTSVYPTPPEDVNIRRMISLRERYGVAVGFSDHTVDELAAVQAVSNGAIFIEKHFTLDHDLEGPDHWFSSMPSEFERLVKAVRRAEVQMGSPGLVPAKGESENVKEFRLSAVAK
ncbi:MAG: N-acetylneuraminate synthase family protein, partial [Bdellovibrionota bacterium]